MARAQIDLDNMALTVWRLARYSSIQSPFRAQTPLEYRWLRHVVYLTK